MRAALTALAVLLAWPAWADPSWPYDCLPAIDADAVHAARGDTLLASKSEERRVLFLFAKAEGGFWIVAFSRATLEACIVEETAYDPRDSVSG